MITYGPRGHTPPSREQLIEEGERHLEAFSRHVIAELKQPRSYVPSPPCVTEIVLTVGRDGTCAVDLNGRRQEKLSLATSRSEQLLSKADAEELVLDLLEKYPNADVTEVTL